MSKDKPKTTNVTVNVPVETPKVPNFILVFQGMGEKFPLSAFSDEQLEIIAADWKRNLLVRAKEMREDAKRF